jgi:hypothetical protein
MLSPNEWHCSHTHPMPLLLLLWLQVPGWEVGAPTSSTGRWIPPPQPKGIWNPLIQ